MNGNSLNRFVLVGVFLLDGCAAAAAAAGRGGGGGGGDMHKAKSQLYVPAFVEFYRVCVCVCG